MYMKILYIAYSCDPYCGSEDKIGWNVPFESAKKNQVYLITKTEHREHIKKYMSDNSVDNMKVYYVDIPTIYKKIFRSFFYSGRLNIWNKRVFPLAKKLCKTKGIDIIHQITPIEFRSIGNYGDIQNIKFVCGPLGGGEKIPHALKVYVKGHKKIIEIIRMYINQYSKVQLKISGKLKKCDYILFANKETKDFLLGNNYLLQKQKIMTEIAISNEDIIDPIREKNHIQLQFLIAGRLIYRKGHNLLLDALERIPEEYSYRCCIVGDGPEYEKIKKRCYKNQRLKNHVILKGNIPFEQMKREYTKTDVLIMPSLRETTGSVILEAMSQGIPVITIGEFGGRTLVNDRVGWLYDGKTKEEYIDNLKNILIECIKSPHVVYEKGEEAYQKAKQYTWNEKCKKYQLIYDTLLNK